ncbi:MAG: MaoC family dehydratase [Chromatiales bacterium]|nr:MaoC family dehydratase [Chromatiales bacterium]
MPSTLLSKPDNDYIQESAFSNRFGHLWMRQKWQFLAPLALGASYDVRGVIQDIYRRRDRNVVQYEARFVDSHGAVVAISEHHQSFLHEPDGALEVTLRDPGKKPGARKFEEPEGEPFGALERTLSVEMCGEFFHGKASYHTDANASKALGFKDIVIGGRMTMAYAAHVLEERFGPNWTAGGHMDVKFINPVWVNDTVTIHGVVTGALQGDPSRTGAFIWLTRQDGAIALICEASVPS